jgi:hypothetical protein
VKALESGSGFLITAPGVSSRRGPFGLGMRITRAAVTNPATADQLHREALESRRSDPAWADFSILASHEYDPTSTNGWLKSTLFPRGNHETVAQLATKVVNRELVIIEAVDDTEDNVVLVAMDLVQASLAIAPSPVVGERNGQSADAGGAQGSGRDSKYKGAAEEANRIVAEARRKAQEGARTPSAGSAVSGSPSVSGRRRVSSARFGTTTHFDVMSRLTGRHCPC